MGQYDKAVRCADPQCAAVVTAKAFGYGFIIERSLPHDEAIKCLLPLTNFDAELEEGLDILERVLIEEISEGLVSAPSINLRSTDLLQEQPAA